MICPKSPNRHKSPLFTVLFLYGWFVYDFMILYWSAPNGIMITRDPVKKELTFAVQRRDVFIVDRKCLSG